MYRFSGKQFRGAMRNLRQEKRREAEERQKQYLLGNSKNPYGQTPSEEDN